MTIRNTFGNVYTQKFVAGFVACVFLVLVLFLTFPVIDAPLVPETYAAAVHIISVKVCAFGVCVTITYTEYHSHTA